MFKISKFTFVLMIASLCSQIGFAKTAMNVREIAAAIDHFKYELKEKIITDDALYSGNSEGISLDSLVAAGASVKSYKVSKDRNGKCMLTLNLSTELPMHYKITDIKKSWFGSLCE